MTGSWTITHWLAAIFLVAVLCSSLAVGALVRVQEEAAVRALAESRARATSGQVLEHVYSAMRHGVAVGELDAITRRLNATTDASDIRLVRSAAVARQYGDRPRARRMRTRDADIAAVLANGEDRAIQEGDTMRFLHPLVLREACTACHAGTVGETVNGVMDVRFSLDALREPLGFLTGTAFAGSLGAVVLIFGAVFVMVRLLVVRPLHALSDTMARLSEGGPRDHRLERRGLRVRELGRLMGAFTRLMDDVARHRTDLEAQAADLARAKEQAEEARQRADAANVAKSDFLASMSHELRTPLNAILGFSEVLRDEVFGPLGEPRYRTYVAHIHDSGCHLRDLVNDLLDLAKIEAGRMDLEPEPICVVAEMAACEGLFRERAADRGLVMVRHCAPDMPPLVADPRAVRQALYNLLSNAIKYTPAGGTVRLTAAVRDPWIEIAVADTGMGIAKELHELVFSAYGRVINVETREIEGTGLGLSLVKALMEQHGGDVRLDSTPGEGSTFTLRFPVRPAPVRLPPGARPAGSGPAL